MISIVAGCLPNPDRSHNPDKMCVISSRMKSEKSTLVFSWKTTYIGFFWSMGPDDTCPHRVWGGGSPNRTVTGKCHRSGPGGIYIVVYYESIKRGLTCGMLLFIMNR